MNSDDILQAQVAYYRARADEYDDWWERRGDFDLGEEFNAAWRADIDELRTWLDGHGGLGDVLELAAGTGIWTAELTQRTRRVTALDASPEVLKINRARLTEQGHAASYVVGDVFSWAPARRFDTIFFSFWISHVPEDRWEQFWEVVGAALAPGGRVLFCDGARPEWATAHGPPRPATTPVGQQQHTGDGRVIRTLQDGSTFEIVKRYWAPPDLEDQLRRLGWRASCAETSFAFMYGSAHAI